MTAVVHRSAPAFAAVRRRSPRLVSALAISIGLTGCSAASLGSLTDKSAASATRKPASSTIDPAYTVAPEERKTAKRKSKKDPVAANLDVFTERAARLAMKKGDHTTAVAHLSKLYELRPKDKGVAYDYARHLRYVGAATLAEQVLNTALAKHKGDTLLQLEKAKLLVGTGRSKDAITILTGLRKTLPKDPSVLQTLAVAHDRRGEHALAQALYAEAMQAGRPSASLLNNAGLSHLLSGAPEAAVALLRRAVVAPGANEQVRQNLALALTLNGQPTEARKFAEEGAPPEISTATLGAFKKIKSAEHPWSRAAAE